MQAARQLGPSGRTMGSALSHASRVVWTRAGIEARQDEIFIEVGDAIRGEIARAMAHIRANGLGVETMEQEDFRVPSIARLIPTLRQRLDDGLGAVVLRGMPVADHDDAGSAVMAWGVANYLGRPLRQGLAKDRRLFSVTDRGTENRDAVRIGASNKLSYMHTDNGCLEPRPPAYIGLLCARSARRGGESTLISAAVLHDTLAAERPDLLEILYQPFHFLPPQLHTWPAGPATITKPILEVVEGEVHVHYARVMVEPGMRLAGTPLTARQTEALDYLDAMLLREDLVYTYPLKAGEFLFTNNLATLHGRLGFDDHPELEKRRLLQRIWLWRRHRGPGDDPVALDAAELHA